MPFCHILAIFKLMLHLLYVYIGGVMLCLFESGRLFGRFACALYLSVLLLAYAPYLMAQTPPDAIPNTNEGDFLPLTTQGNDEDNPQSDILPDLAADTQDTQTRLDRIDETLRLLTRQFEALPLANSLPVRNGADQEALLVRLVAIEEQLQSLQSNGLAANASGAGADTASTTELADLRVRLTQIEDIMRALNGQIEQVAFNLTKLAERFEQVAADTEFRFQELELATRRSGGNPARATDETQVLGTLSAPLPVEQITTGEELSLVGEAPLDNGRTLAAVPPNQTQQTSNTPQGTPANPRELYDDALDKLRQGAYGEAQVQPVNFLQFFPKHNLAGNAQYWLGETHYVQRDFKAAAAAFLRGYTDYAESRKAPDSLLKLGMTLIMMGEKSTGCDAFAELASRFPDASQPVIQRAEIERQRADCL